uniref:E3 ubiquitin-protein ligase rnf213-beta-like n=1 Tax=Styela clava TaxID=7725 RepID=UPI00193945A5|nr:E3 ubiquitin-protein ligase rnf213-beta-like [Styela clava]
MAGHFATSLPTYSENKDQSIQLHLYLLLEGFDDSVPANKDYDFVCQLGKKEICYEKKNHFYYATTKILADTKKLKYKVAMRFSALDAEELYCGERVGVRKQKIEKGFDQVATFDVMNRQPQVQPQRHKDIVWENILKTEIPKFLLDEEDFFPWKQKLRSWIHQIGTGWTLKVPHAPNDIDVKMHKENISQVYRDALNKVKGFTPSENISKMITFVVMTSPDLKIESRDHDIICKALAMHNLTENEQKALHAQTKKDAKEFRYGKNLKNVISSLFENIYESNQPDWILALPLYWLINNEEYKHIHFTFEDSNCDVELPQTMGKDWASVLKNMKSDYSQRRLKDIFEQVVKLSKLHPWIARPYFNMMECTGMMTLLSEHQDLRFDPKIIVSILSSHLKDGKLELTDMQAVDRYFSKFVNDVCVKENRNKEPHLIIFIVENIVEATLKKDLNWKVLIWTMNILSKCVNADSGCKVLRDGTEGQVIRFAQAAETFIEKINIDITNCWKNFFGNNIDNLTQIFNCKWQSELIQKIWLAKISKCLEDKIKEFGSMASNFLEAYSSLPDILNKDLEKIFDEAAYNFFRSLFECNDLFGYGWLNSQWEMKNLSKFSEKFFQEESKSESLRYKDETNDQEKQLEFVLNWKHSAIFYHHIYGKLELQEDSHIKKFTNVLKKSVLEDLQTKQIPLGMLIILSSKPDVVKKLVLELKSDSQELNEQALGNLERLRKDVINFRNMVNRAQELKTLCIICKQVGIELQNHETMTAIPDSYQTVTLREMEKFIHLSDDVDWEDTKWFLISYIKPRMENVVFFHRSTEIPQIFRGKLTNLSTKETLSLLSRFIGTLHEYAEQIAQGDISIKILQTWAESLREPGKTLENEVANFYKDTMYNKAGQDSNAQEEIIKDIRKKIQWYVKVMDCKPFIDMLISLKDKFDLKGNEFDTCLKIKEFLKDEMSQLKFLITISSFIPTLDNLLNKFKSSSVDMPKIAASFLKENEFFEWLQNKLIDIAELGVLAELALTFGIDGGVKTVSSFVSAVNGFEPLLFNMHELTFEQLLRKCERLMENATADEDLVENWHISAVNLEFFQEIEFSHGSIEKSSLQAVRSINEKGIFNIRLKPGQPATLENVVQVYIPSNGTSTDQPSGRRDALDFIYLRNLQSTLTLMGELVDTRMPARYSHIFGIVEKLANALIRLVEDGFTLFNGCCIRILPGEGEHIRMKIFFKGEEGESVQQRFSLTDAEVVERELDKTHMKWKQHVKDLRMKYYYLNEYSINQIVYLCNQLSDESLTAETHQDQVNALLSIICPEITFNDIRKLLETTKEHLLETKQKIDQKEPEECDDANDDEMQKMKDGVEKVIGAMKRKRRQTERLAKAAVMEKGWSDIKQCKTWIMMNESNQTIIKELSTQFDRKIVDLKNSKMSATTEASVNSGIPSTQETILKYLNEKCMFFTADFAVSDRKDFISMAHLGEFLTQLSHRNKIEKLKRILPWPLQPGQPNLLTCSDQDMLLRVISLYMEDLDQPLPTASEVLICTEKTTEDNVERFFCRAMSESENNGSPLFCIAYLNRLTDSVMKAAENIYEDLKKFGYKNYQLVVLSNDSTNYLANSFKEFQVADNFVKDPKEISCYVQKHLIVGNKFNKSIAGVDKFRSSVRFVVSSTVGAGKSLHISRKKDEAKKDFKENPRIATLRFLEKEMKPDMAIRKLLPKQFRGSYKDQIFVHIDITNAVEKGIEEFLFNLFVLGRIVDKSGKVWIKHPNQYYMIEITDQDLVSLKYSKISMLNIFPNIVALQPQEVISGKFKEYYHNTIAMDSEMFKSQLFQRPYHNLKCYREYITTPKKKEKSLNEFTYSENKEKGTQEECIKILLEYCGDKASWSQIEHFVTFLDSQLKMCEIWYKENKKLINDAKSIVMKYIIEMGKRFIGVVDDNENNSAPKDKSMIFFHEVNLDNKREVHMTFFEVKKVPPNLLKLFKESDKIGGKLHRVEEFDDLEREKQLRTLRLITDALNSNEDPDPTYKLTTDNLQKIISLNMRIQCKIPVILEGETGCGKTRMVEFLSKLKASDKNARVLITRKVYGGVTASDIQKSVKEAEKVWSQSKTDQDTRLIFFDEANTTEAIYAIKEVMCDNTFDGEAVAMKNTTIIAACNPHKEMSETAIEHLMSCGLGSKIHANQADEKSGSGMRNLVYKVLPLPPSMKPYVWVTKQADETTENLYIEQIAKNITSIVKTEDLSKLVSEAHQFIKEHNDGFRFVSLRDVERCMKVYEWFHNNSDVLFPLIDEEKHNVYQDGTFPSIEPDFRKLIHAINVCYHASLQHNRSEFREKICHTLKNLRVSNLTEYDLLQEFLACQRVFLLQAQIQSSENISYNRALMENFFMMVVCVDLRIPLFVIGKPGSSKSLAKTLVSNCMRGRFSESKLFSKLKQANLMSYQCSALSDAAGIIHTFEQCCDMQENNDSNTFTSVAVLDEIGLAEDSPAMPLKVLHPLLEFGSIKNNERGHQVAFLGLSNWPLDPAKLNRGVFLFHENPDNEDLYKTATEICAINEQSHPNAQKILKTLTKVYLDIETNQDVKYFGLRDFYSLIKSCNGHFGDPKSLFEAVGRNFGGMESDVLEKFKSEICKIFPHSELVLMPIKEVVQTNLGETDSRYLLLLTNYYPSINLVSLVVKNFDKMKVIVGSAFPGDQTFAKICRNIQEVKTCMETGTPVVMLILAEIQESLYDALNQHYNTLGGKRYVDIGLGGQRLKCCVAENFRLIILEKKDKAYTEYPIPLLNRLEKHLLDSDGLLPESEKDKMVEVQKWTELFVAVDFQKSDSLVGHQKDTVSSTLLLRPDQEECKVILLQSATLDAMYRIKKNIIDLDKMKKLHSTYFEKQSHYKLTCFLNQTLEILGTQKKLPISIFEIVSYSGILVGNDREQLEKNLNLKKYDVMILNIRQFYTLREFEHDVDIFLQECRDYKQDTSKKINAKILVLQCPQAHKYAKLIECAKHSWSNKDKTGISITIIVIVLWSIERNTEFLMQQAQDNRIIYIDEVRSFQTDETKADPTASENFFSTETLLNTNLVDIFAPKNASNKFMKKFLQDSLSKAMTKIEGSQIASTRYKARVKTLTNLLQTDEKIGKSFRNKFLDKIHKILMSEDTLKCNEWIHLLANDKKSLQEGGTFHKALLLYLKTLISNLIAHFICNIDVQCNLNLIEKFPDVYHQDRDRTENIWLSMFEKLSFDHLRPDWMHKEFIAVSPITERPTMACEFPFGCVVTGSLQTHLISEWESSSKDCNASLVKFFRQHSLYPVIKYGISTYPELLQGYVHDLVNSHYTPSSEQHPETEVNAVIKLVEKRAFDGKDNVEQADKFPLVYSTFIDLKDKLRILREVFKVSPLVAESINTVMPEKIWNWHDGDIHHWGMLKALEDLRQKTTFFSENPESCLSWLEQAKSIKKTVYLVHDCIQEQKKKR